MLILRRTMHSLPVNTFLKACYSSAAFQSSLWSMIVTSENRGPWYEPYHRLFKSLIELSAHLLMLGAVLGGIKLLEVLVHRLWGADYFFFGRVKLKYIFDSADLLTLVGFLSWGVYSVVGSYIRKPG